MSTFLKHIVICASLTACSTIDHPGVDQTTQAVTCPVPSIDPARSLEITDQAVLTAANFSFHRVMSKIINTAGATNTPLDLWQSWMATFADCTNTNINPNGYDLVCPRIESTLGSINPFNSTSPLFVPVALANRFDLAPKSGADCGEYRIVYAMQPGTATTGRAFIIFEGRLSNPTPSLGISGCAPVADFWAQLSTDPSATSRASKLENFYFTGLPGFDPVVQASNYGLPVSGARNGQIRTNMFVQNMQWNLREFRLSCSGSTPCTLSAQHVTVKDNPAGVLFAKDTPQFAPMFQSAFLNQVCPLSQDDPAQITMSMSNNNFNKFESVSSGSGSNDVLYANFTESSFRTQIQNQIATLSCNPSLSSLTVNNILDRATTQTCAGCHQLSTSFGASPPHNQLGNGVVWPDSRGFVHIDEQGHRSPALINVFLPHRASVLTSFLNNQCSSVPLVDDGTTLSGGAIDAAN